MKISVKIQRGFEERFNKLSKERKTKLKDRLEASIVEELEQDDAR